MDLQHEIPEKATIDDNDKIPQADEIQNDTSENGTTTKKHRRRRRKHIYAAIRQLVEFYLSDVNLTKDRFFAGKLKESPYIDMDLILNCNRIRKLTTDASDIIKSLENSSLVSTTEDGTKLFRTKPVERVENEDECTIYVEDLPISVNHEWLQNLFKTYGDVIYVSLPKYRESGKFKGFAFVQFKTPEGAMNALKAFERVNSCLSSSMPSAQLKSIDAYEGDRNYVVRQLPIQDTDVQYIPLQSDDKVNVSEVDNVGNQHADSSVSDVSCDEERLKKKRKSKLLATDVDNTVEKNLEEDENSTDEQKPKIKRKRKHKKKAVKHDVETYGMHILSKKDWKKLRNKYLDEQKKRARELKCQLQQAKHRRFADESSHEETTDLELEETDKVQHLAEDRARVQFSPGVIVKITLNIPIKKVKPFKNEIRSISNVQYVDIGDHYDEVYVRCSSSHAAEEFVTSGKWPVMEILRGDEEQAYWKKVFADREEKMEKKIRMNKIRGKDKLKKKIVAGDLCS